MKLNPPFLHRLLRRRHAPSPDGDGAKDIVQRRDASGELALVFMLQLDADARSRVLEADAQRHAAYAQVVFVTDAVDVRYFSTRGMICERLPSVKDVRPETMTYPWRQYLQRRHALIRAKWRPKWTISYGLDFDAFLDAFEARVAELRERRRHLRL